MKTEIEKLFKRREKLFEKLSTYQSLQNRMFNLKDHSRSIKRTVSTIHRINEKIYSITNLDKKSIAL